MSKIRVFEIAKELQMENRELIAKLQGLGYAVKSHSSTLTEDEADAVKRELGGGGGSAAQPAVRRQAPGRVAIRRRVVRTQIPSDTEGEAPTEQVTVLSEHRIDPNDVTKSRRVIRRRPAADAAEAPEAEARPEPSADAAEPSEPEAPAVPDGDAVEEEETVVIEDRPATASDRPATASAPKTLDWYANAAQGAEAPADATPDGEAPAEAAAPAPAEEAPAAAEAQGEATAEGDAPAEKAEAAADGEVADKAANGEGEAAGEGEKPAIRWAPGYGPDAPPRPGRNPHYGGVQELRVVSGFGRRREFVDVTNVPGKPGGPQKGKKQDGRRRELLIRREMMDSRQRGYRPPRVKRKAKGGKKTEVTTPKAIKRVIRMEDSITVGDLAHRMGIKANEIIGRLISQGMMVSVNQSIDFDTASVIAMDFGFEIESVAFEEEKLIEEVEDAAEDLITRSPVVTVMGHVDHGKTSLLDYIRKARVADGEAGGITQHIGAYQVGHKDRDITFIDTPGHAAFTAMRARGAQVTDIVILVVAADDSAMPQTLEAISHSKDAGVPIIVAVNKCDKPDADPERVRRDLANHGLQAEEWGGDTTFVNVSAKTGQNIDQLLEMVLLQADVLELKANPDRLAKGTVIEAKLERGRGPVTTVIITDGTVRVGDAVVCGPYFGRVRALINDAGKNVKEASLSMPVEVLGLNGVPDAGEVLNAVAKDKMAKLVGEHRALQQRQQELSRQTRISLEDFYKQAAEAEQKELKLVVKSDVQGTVEAVGESFTNLTTEKVKVTLVHSGVGDITENDVNLAKAAGAIIVGFNVKASAAVSTAAEREGVEVRTYNVIYEAIDDVRLAMEGLLESILEEEYVGRAEVRLVFNITKVGTIGGSMVQDGKIIRNLHAKLLRDGESVWTGKIGSLKRFKEDVKEVASGFECGIGLEGYNALEEGDIIEVFELKEVRPSL